MFLRRHNFLCGLISLAISVFSWPAAAQPDSSADVQPTKRLALVIGNSEYLHHGRIPSSAEDARNAATLLRRLGFEVFEALNVKNGAEFWNLHFLPLVNKIQENDFVAFFFSGHGLSYGGENFLVMLDAEKEIPESSALDVLIPLTAMRDFFKRKSPGVSAFFLDACRTMAGSTIKRADGQKDDIPKGPAQLSATAQNVVITFSSDFGTLSKGREDPGKMSYFTEALLEFLGEEDKEFDFVRRNTRTRVLQLTEQTQIPWFSASSSGEIYFNPSQKILDQEETVWRARKATNDYSQIWWFTLEYATSRFVAAAKRMLANLQRTAGLTKVPPIEFQTAWSSDPKKLITVSRIDGPYAFSTISTEPVEEAAATERRREARARGRKPDAAEMLARSGSVVVTQKLRARASPDQSAPVLATIDPGTTVEIKDVHYNQGISWLQVELQSGKAFLPGSERVALSQSRVGFSLREIEVPRAPGGLESLVDEKPILSTVAELKGKGITRVAAFAPYAPDGSRLKVKLSGRLAHAALVLENAGIPRGAITATAVDDEELLKRENIRIRFFGQ